MLNLISALTCSQILCLYKRESTFITTNIYIYGTIHLRRPLGEGGRVCPDFEKITKDAFTQYLEL